MRCMRVRECVQVRFTHACTHAHTLTQALARAAPRDHGMIEQSNRQDMAELNREYMERKHAYMQEHSRQFSDVVRREQEAMQAARIPGFVDVTPGTAEPDILQTQSQILDYILEYFREHPLPQAPRAGAASGGGGVSSTQGSVVSDPRSRPASGMGPGASTTGYGGDAAGRADHAAAATATAGDGPANQDLLALLGAVGGGGAGDAGGVKGSGSGGGSGGGLAGEGISTAVGENGAAVEGGGGEANIDLGETLALLAQLEHVVAP